MTPLYEILGYDEYFNSILLKKVKISLNDVVLRMGVFTLYNYKNYSLELFFKTNVEGKLRKTILPIPFKMYKKNEKIILDYSIDEIYPFDNQIKDKIIKNPNKFLNNKIEIVVLNGK